MDQLIPSGAKLPVSYMAAKKALANCARVDECQEWANKAHALASYARQAKDETLRRLADRIQARASRRCGELLKQVPPGQGGHTARKALESQIVIPSRKAAAEEAGLSKRQKDQAMNIANIPEATFEALVESENPPRVYQLAQMGVEHRPTTSTVDVSAIRKFARFCGSTDAASLATSVESHDLKQELKALIGEIDSWLDQFITQI